MKPTSGPALLRARKVPLAALVPLFHALTDGVIIADAGGDIAVANAAAHRLLGVTADELLGTKLDAADWIDAGAQPHQAGRFQTRYERAVDLQGRVLLQWVVIAERQLEAGAPSRRARQASERARLLERALANILRNLDEAELVPGRRGARHRAARLAGLDRLTSREQEVAVCLHATGAVRAVADRLCIVRHTVYNHLRSIYRKLGIGSKAELMAMLV